MPRFPQLAPVAEQLCDRVFSAPGAPAGKPRWALNVGDTYLPPPACARAEAQRVADHPRLHNYSPVQGEPALLTAIGAHLQRRAGPDAAFAPPPDNVQVMSGATAGLATVCTALLQPGDEVLLPSPFWPLIHGIIRSRGAVPVEVPLWTALDSPGFDLASALDAATTDRTVALYLNSPNNPTGQVLDAAQLDTIGAFAAAHDLWVLSDEVYEDLYLGDGPPVPSYGRPSLRARTVATHSVSKAYGLAGARVGFTHGPAEVMPAIRGVQTYLTYCAAKPMQLAAAAALDDGAEWLAQARAHYAEAAAMAANRLGLCTPPAGTFLFFDLRPYLGRDQADTGSAALLARAAEAGVLLTPGRACGRDYGTWARLCFTAVGPRDLERAVDALANALNI